MKKNISLSSLFYNNKFIAVLSVVISVLIWLVVSVELSPETTVVVYNVPVTVDSSSAEILNLKTFDDNDYTVNVTIRGKKYIVESKENQQLIRINADSTSVTSSGTYYLPLTPSIDGDKNLFDIESISQSDITVYYDYETSKEFRLDIENEGTEEIVPEGYMSGEISGDFSVIKATGPKSEINKIEKIVVHTNITESLTTNYKETCPVEAVTKDGSLLNHTTFNHDQVNVTIPVYKVVTMAAGVEFTGKPFNYIDGLPYTVSPASAKFGIAEEQLDSDDTAVMISSIDFSSIKPGVNTFKIKAEDIENCIVLDGTKEFTVTVNAENVYSVSVKAEDNINIQYINGEEDKILLAQPEFDELILVGPRDVAQSIANGNITLTLDLSAAEKTHGDITLPVTFTDKQAWLYGTYNVTLTKE